MTKEQCHSVAGRERTKADPRHSSNRNGFSLSSWSLSKPIGPMAVTGIEPSGERARVRLDGPLPLVAEITAASLADLRLQVGTEVWASVKATELHAYLR